MAKSPSAHKEDFWRRTLAEHAQSGLSVKAFCQQKSLAVYSYHHWKREIAKRDHKAAGLPSLLPVRIVDALQQPRVMHSPTLRISLPGRIIIEIFSENGA